MSQDSSWFGVPFRVSEQVNWFDGKGKLPNRPETDLVRGRRRRDDDRRSWLRGQDLHLRLEVMSLSYCPTLLPRHNFQKSGPGGRS
jgi:hypothetical protein